MGEQTTPRRPAWEPPNRFENPAAERRFLERNRMPTPSVETVVLSRGSKPQGDGWRHVVDHHWNAIWERRHGE